MTKELERQIEALIGFHTGHTRLATVDIENILGSCSIYRVNDWFYQLMFDCRPRWMATPEYDRFTDNIQQLAKDFVREVLKLDPEDIMASAEYSKDEATKVHPNFLSGMYLLVDPKFLDASTTTQETLHISYAD